MNKNGRRPSIEEQAARIQREVEVFDSPALRLLISIADELRWIREDVVEVKEVLDAIKNPGKEHYTCAELSEILGVSQHTIQFRWCRQGRIECKQEGGRGNQYLIPAHEVERLRNGGKPRKS